MLCMMYNTKVDSLFMLMVSYRKHNVKRFPYMLIEHCDLICRVILQLVLLVQHMRHKSPGRTWLQEPVECNEYG